jgi:hypothetical protein
MWFVQVPSLFKIVKGSVEKFLAGVVGLVECTDQQSGQREYCTKRKDGQVRFSQRLHTTKKIYLIEVVWSLSNYAVSGSGCAKKWKEEKYGILQRVSTERITGDLTTTLSYSGFVHARVQKAAKELCYAIAKIE